MLYGLRTIWYFTWRGLIYGTFVGALGGTFTVPVLGTMIAGAWGAGVGAGIGVFVGIIISIYNLYARNQHKEHDSYQSDLMKISAILTIGITAFFVHHEVSQLPDMDYILWSFLLLVAPFSGFTAAFVAHGYADLNAHHIMKRKNDDLENVELPTLEAIKISQYVRFFFNKAKWLYFPLLTLFTVIVLINGARYGFGFASPIQLIGETILQWSVYFVVITGLVGSTIEFFITMLNRVVFSPQFSKTAYKQRLSIFAGLFALVITPVVGLGIGAPILAILAALAARDYADWRSDEHSHLQKKKRDSSRLAEMYAAAFDENAMLIVDNDESVVQQKRR